MRRAVLLVALMMALAIAGCGGGNGRSSSGPRSDRLQVVATTTHTAHFSEIVGGDRVDVYGVVKANVDPHDFEPSPADLDALAEADVIVRNGVGLEGWFNEVIKSAESKAEVVDASIGVPIRKGDGSDEQQGGDPHIWQNPQNAIRMVTTIEAAFSRADSANRAVYEKNREDYVATLRSLDEEVQRQIDGLPNKKVVTNHDALGYFVERYGLEFVGAIIPSFDTQAELSARDIDDLVAKIRSTGVKTVFSESSVPPRTAEAIGREAGVKVVAGEDALYVDTLGPPGSGAETYVGMIRHNTRVIVDNLR